MLKFVLTFLIALLLSGCATSAWQTQPAMAVATIKGTLSSRAQDACDREWNDRKLILAHTLDQLPPLHQSSNDLTGFTRGIFPLKTWGVIRVVDDSAPMPRSPPFEHSTSWKEAWEFNQSHPPPAWRGFRGYVQRLVFNDYRRLTSATDMTSDWTHSHDDRAAIKTIEACVNLATCQSKDLDPTLLNDLSKRASLRGFVESMRDSALSSQQQRDEMENLLRSLRYGQGRFIHAADPMVRREGRWLILPLVDFAFGSQRDEFAHAMEYFWSSPELSLKIEWLEDQTAPPEVYRIYPGPSTAVAVFSRRLFVESLVSVRALAHEVGHTLGLADEYAEVWDEKNCRYLFRQRTSGLMGSVMGTTIEEMKLLETLYPLKQKNP